VTKILVIDDEPQILRALKTNLVAHGYDVGTAGTGKEGLERVASWKPDCVIVDLGLPDLDGTEVILRTRSWSDVPMIVLSVRDAQSDKVKALDAGADDYVNKPFGMDELLARMRAALRRVSRHEPDLLRFGEIEVDLERTLVRRNGEDLHLTPIEYELLEAFVRHPGKLLTHGWLLKTVWGKGYSDEQNHYLRIYVRQLRRKLGDDATTPRYVKTESGMGYRWIHPAG
jgi:two-component system KDP operon response regulator KdpE